MVNEPVCADRATPATAYPLHAFAISRREGGKLAGYTKALIKSNKLLDGEYVEPYAGGAAIPLELLFHEYVSRVHIDEISRPVHAFWSSVFSDTNELCMRVRDTALTIDFT